MCKNIVCFLSVEITTCITSNLVLIKTDKRTGVMLIKLLESEIKIMLKLQIGQILNMSKSDLS